MTEFPGRKWPESKRKRTWRTSLSAGWGALAFLAAGCGAAYDPATSLGKRAILDAANLALTLGDCDGALNSVLGLYNSAYTDNEVRMTMASAYGCKAKVNLFSLIGDITASSPAVFTPITGAGSMSGLQLWVFLTKTFTSATGADYVVEGSFYGIDALLSVLKSSAVVLPAGQINPTSRNPGSVYLQDRTADSNAFLFFMTMAAMGGVQNRYGAPYSNGLKSVNLPWRTAVTMDSVGCGYASAFVNFVDSLSGLSTSTTGSLANTFGQLKTQFATTLSAACDNGCKGTAVTAATTVGGVPGLLAQTGHAWTPTGCAIAAGCQGCPDALRNRSSCTNLATDASSCAAAGIVNYINNGLAGWPDGP